MYAPRQKQNKEAVKTSNHGLRPADRLSDHLPADLENSNENQSGRETTHASPGGAGVGASPPGEGNHFKYNFADISVFPRPVRGLQAKLTVNVPGDAYEQEADRVAEQVMRMPEPSAGSSVSPVSSTAATAGAALQRECACGGTCDDCKKKSHDEQHAKVQMKAAEPVNASGMEAPPIVHEVLHSSGQPLDPATRAFMEPRFGHDFRNVRVHTDERAAESARAVGARAYTVGSNVVFGAGEYGPGAQAGQRLLGHELAHVVQQKHVHALPVMRKETDSVSKEDAARNRAIEKAKDFLLPLWDPQTLIQRVKQEEQYFNEPDATDEDRQYSADIMLRALERLKQYEDSVTTGPTGGPVYQDMLNSTPWPLAGKILDMPLFSKSNIAEWQKAYSFRAAAHAHKKNKKTQPKSRSEIQQPDATATTVTFKKQSWMTLASPEGKQDIARFLIQEVRKDLSARQISWALSKLDVTNKFQAPAGMTEAQWISEFSKDTEEHITVTKAFKDDLDNLRVPSEWDLRLENTRQAFVDSGPGVNIFGYGTVIVGATALSGGALIGETIGAAGEAGLLAGEKGLAGALVHNIAPYAAKYAYLNAPAIFGTTMGYAGTGFTAWYLANHTLQIAQQGVHWSDLPQLAEDMLPFVQGYAESGYFGARGANESNLDDEIETSSENIATTGSSLPIQKQLPRGALLPVADDANASANAVPSTLGNRPFWGGSPFLRKLSLATQLSMRGVDQAIQIPSANSSSAISSAPAAQISSEVSPDFLDEAPTAIKSTQIQPSANIATDSSAPANAVSASVVPTQDIQTQPSVNIATDPTATNSGVQGGLDTPSEAKVSAKGALKPKRLKLFHGSSQKGFEGLHRGRIDVRASTHENQDFGHGFYMSEDIAVAEQAASSRNLARGGGMQHIMSWDIAESELGTIVDIRPGGAQRQLWEQFLKQRPSVAKLSPRLAGEKNFATNRAYLESIGSEQRGVVFEEFLKQNDLSDADVIMGEIGGAATTGAAAPTSGPSTQIVIRSQRIADKLNQQARD